MADMDDPHPGYAVFDTEGTGLFDYKQPADAPGQPRMASLAIVYVNEKLEIEREINIFVRPDVNDYFMSEGAQKAHGLTVDFLNEHGVPVTEALNEFCSAVDNGRIMVAHNSQHDMKQMRAELRRAGMQDRFEGSPNICTMRAMTDICKIPPRGNRGGYKWPALSEALLFIGETDLGDHSAINDAKGALALLRYLKRTGNLPDAKVHYAKQPLGERHPPNQTPMMPMPDKD
jgi:DNA polymerase III epsilon subunit-like protein